MLPRAPTSTLFPYTTLFRSHAPRIRTPRVGAYGEGPSPGRLDDVATFSLSILPPDEQQRRRGDPGMDPLDRKSTRLNSSHEWISYAVFCLKKKIERNNK